MTIKYITPLGTASAADSWSNSCNVALFLSTVRQTLVGGDTVLLSRNPTENSFVSKVAFGLPANFAGTAGNRSTFKSGGFPTANDVTGHDSKYSLPMIGTAAYPWRAPNGEGAYDQLDIQGDYIDVVGINHYNGRFGVQVSANFAGIYESSFFNCHEGITVIAGYTDTIISGVNMKAVRKNSIRLQAGCDRTSISNFAIDCDGIVGAAFPNGILVEGSADVSIKHGYISNLNYTTPSDSYLQGDGITVNVGTTDVLIEDVHISNCTDRGIDSKSANTCVVACSVVGAKHGVACWDDADNYIIATTIEQIRAARDEGSCVQNVGTVSIINCHLVSGALHSPVDNSDTGAVIMHEDGALNTYLVGGSIETDGLVNIARFKGAGCTLTVVGVLINGVYVTDTYTYTGSNDPFWNPS